MRLTLDWERQNGGLGVWESPAREVGASSGGRAGGISRRGRARVEDARQGDETGPSRGSGPDTRDGARVRAPLAPLRCATFLLFALDAGPADDLLFGWLQTQERYMGRGVTRMDSWDLEPALSTTSTRSRASPFHQLSSTKASPTSAQEPTRRRSLLPVEPSGRGGTL